MNTRQTLMAATLISAGMLSGAGGLTPEAASMIRKTDLGRQEIVHRGDTLVREGHKLFEKKDYFGARDKYIEAVKLFRRFPSRFFQEKVEFCQKEIAACYFAKANEAARHADKMALASDFDEAIKICKEAIKYCPEQADELEKRIVLYEKRRDIVTERSAFTAGRLIPNKDAQDYQIQVLLEQARRLTLMKDYSTALVKYNEVLLIDPFNADATQGKRVIAHRISVTADNRYVNTHRKVMAEVEWKYAIPIIPEVSGEAANVVETNQPKPKNTELKMSPLRVKLDEIIIPAHSYMDTSISAVIKNLQDLSRANDLKSKRGVNIVYIPDARNIDETPEEKKAREDAEAKRKEAKKNQQKNSKKNANDGDEEEASEESEDDADVNDKRITLEGGKRSLFGVLSSLCEVGELNMQVEDFAVIITPKNVTLSNMELMTFPVTIPQNLASMRPDEISKEIKMTLETKSGNRNIFPSGSSIYYNPYTKRVSITNTVENLRVLQGVIEQVFRPKTGTMVQIMIKLIDINQEDLDELAFNWQLAVNSNQSRVVNQRNEVIRIPTGDKDENGNPKYTTVTRPRYDLSRKMVTELNNPLLRYYTSAGDANVGNVDDSLLSWVWENEKGTRLVASMFALNQADSADVLMSPRVTVKANHVATVKMVEHRYFPEPVWNTIDVPEQDDATFRATAQPSLEEEEELGINFTIRPEVTDAGDLITAEVHVPFKTLAGWMEYDTRKIDKDGNVEDGDYYRMPIFNTPEIKTRVTVRDGETVIVGGIVSDQTSTINDKIPILGDIPFIGRFFQSKGSKSVKRNLLVFMTCRLVKPDGSPVNPEPRQLRDGTYSKGLPRFGSTL
ncbi:MAG: type II and III secretion system protein [Lentisphaeria bacterium]|nr:type II and III secretion system protein [Lentisphaeria bacterium]